MARQIRSWNPGDAANAYVRMLLSEVGRLVGGITDEQWDRTRAFFDGRCAYTGEPLSDADAVTEHAVPINRRHCGVHAYGNVLPASKAANDAKAGMHYREYVATVVGDETRLARIEDFVRESGYETRIEPFGDLRRYCEQQYRQVVALGEVNKTYLRSFVDGATEAAGLPRGAEDNDGLAVEAMVGEPLPIRFDPPGPGFKGQLLSAREAWVTTYYADGRVESRRWDASRMSTASNVIGNLRSRPEYRNPMWRQLGISRVLATICPVFVLRLEETYYRKGFFNVTVDYDRYAGPAGPIELVLGDAPVVAGRIDRDAQQNGTARIHGGAALRDWFQRGYSQGDAVAVRFRSPWVLELG